jgi:hypothetical protein
MIFSKDGETAFDKIHHPLMIIKKTLRKLKINGTSKLIENICTNPIAIL